MRQSLVFSRSALFPYRLAMLLFHSSSINAIVLFRRDSPWLCLFSSSLLLGLSTQVTGLFVMRGRSVMQSLEPHKGSAILQDNRF